MLEAIHKIFDLIFSSACHEVSVSLRLDTLFLGWVIHAAD